MQLSNEWGVTTQINLKECDPDLITSREAIQDYVIQLCKRIETKRLGDVLISSFGVDEKEGGYSMVQFIDAFLISGHFHNGTNVAYIDIFSSKAIDPHLISDFTKEFFNSQQCEWKTHLRV